MAPRLAEALAHAHNLGVLHRDVKPANVLLNRYGRPLLADFNVSFTAHSGGGGSSLGGTLEYMAPEHLAAFTGTVPVSAVDERADLYSLGLVLFELLAGRSALPKPRPGPMEELVRAVAEFRRGDRRSSPRN